MIDQGAHVAFPRSDPGAAGSEVLATVTADVVIAGLPVWTMRSVSVGPGGPDYEQHLADSFGSSFDSTDEFRFDARTGKLSGVILEVPEEGELEEATARSWADLEPRLGLPTIAQLGLAFSVDRLDRRHLDADGQYLIAAARGLSPADALSRRLQIATDLDLLFASGRYCGWILRAPVQHLTDAAAADSGAADEDRELLALLRDYLTLVIEPTLEKMSDGDPQTGDRLDALAQRASRLSPGPAATVLRGQIADLRLMFYADGT